MVHSGNRTGGLGETPQNLATLVQDLWCYVHETVNERESQNNWHTWIENVDLVRIKS